MTNCILDSSGESVLEVLRNGRAGVGSLEGRGSAKPAGRAGGGNKPSTGKSRKSRSGGKSSASAATADRSPSPKKRAKSKAPKSGKGSAKKHGRRQKKK